MASRFKITKEDENEIIKGIRLDSFLKSEKISQIELLKIDTEGSEYDVLQTGKNTVKKSKFILLEASVDRQSSGDILDCIDFIKHTVPNLRLFKIGRIFQEADKIVAVDLLFKQ